MMGYMVFAIEAAQQAQQQAQNVPMSMDPQVKAVLIGLLTALTTLALAAAGWFARQKKTEKESESKPGYQGRRETDKRLEQVESHLHKLRDYVNEKLDKMKQELKQTGEVAQELGETLVERMNGIESRLDEQDEKLERQTAQAQRIELQTTRTATNMEHVLQAIQAIKQKLNIV